MAVGQSGDNVQGWILERVVGTGSFATVWKAHKRTGEEQRSAAIKIIATEKLLPKLKQSLECEVSILKRISHNNVVRLHESVKGKSSLSLVMEYCSGGDLAEYIRAHKRIPETKARSFIQHLAAGLKELWQNNFVHRDLKPQNLLLSDSSEDAVLKIADFGFARDLQPQRMADTLCGSPLYMAPEILQYQKYDAKADLWSVGIILYELLIGYVPFDGGNHIQLLRNIERHDVCIPAAAQAKLSPHSTHLIYSLLKRNPIERMSFEEFFAHPFVGAGSLPESFYAPAPGPSVSHARTPALPTIASTVAFDTSSSGEEQLPFALEAQSWSNRRHRTMQRVESEPPTPVSKRVLVRQPQQPVFQGLRTHRLGPKEMPQISLSNSLEDDDDYVIIERTPSSGALRGYSQSAPNSSLFRAQGRPKVVQVPPPPPPLTVPLLAQSPPRMNASNLAHSAGTLKFTSGLPQSEALRRAGLLVEDIASQYEAQSSYAEALSLRLLSLQVLSHAMGQDSNFKGGSRVLNDSGTGRQMADIAEKAQQVGSLLQLECPSNPLPYVWGLIYKSALSSAKAGAVEEMLGNTTASLKSYSKAGSLLYFMFGEALKLNLRPALHLENTDIHRLQRYAACIALRHQGCSELLRQSHKKSMVHQATIMDSGKLTKAGSSKQ